MPTIYTHDPVGQAIEDHAIGRAGVLTGNSVANQMGFNEYQSAGSVSSGSGYSGGGGRRYEMFGFMDALLHAIPGWVHGLFALIGAALGAWFGGLEGGREAAMGMIALGGLVGWVSITLTIALIDFALKLAMLGVGAAAVLGVGYVMFA